MEGLTYNTRSRTPLHNGVRANTEAEISLSIPDSVRLPVPDSVRLPVPDSVRLPVPDSARLPVPDSARLPSKESIWHKIFKKNPNYQSPIYIQHKYADTKFGDKFGAELWTYNNREADGTIYKQHFLVNVKSDAPVAEMKIESYDEVVLLNGSFVPDLEHSEVLDLFKNVKVDGKTRFKLVLRRLVVERSKNEWEWLETSAILAPDRVQDLDNFPEVEDKKHKLVRSNEYISSVVCCFQIPPKEQYYLDVKDNHVVADVMTGTSEDKSKRILKHVHMTIESVFPLRISKKVTLQCEINSKYIVIDHGKKVKLDKTPMYFDFVELGSRISFNKDGRYLGCNNKNLKIEPRTCIYWFEETDPRLVGVGHSKQTELNCDASSDKSTSL